MEPDCGGPWMPSWEAWTWFQPMNECIKEPLLSGHLEETWWFPWNQTNPSVVRRKWPSQVTVAWCCVLVLSQPDWVTLDKFLHLSGSWISSLWKEKWTWGSAGTLLVLHRPTYQASFSSSPSSHVIMTLCSVSQSTLGLEFLNASPPATLYPLLPTPLPNNSAFLFPRKPHFANGAQSSKMQPKQSKWATFPPLHPAEHGGVDQYLISLQYYVSFKYFNPFNKKRS